MPDIRNITNDRQFRAATGYDKATFYMLLSDFACEYKEQKGKSYEDYLSEDLFPHEEAKLKTLEEILFFLLFQKKNDMTWDTLGVVFNMSTTRTHIYYTKFLLILETALEKKK